MPTSGYPSGGHSARQATAHHPEHVPWRGEQRTDDRLGRRYLDRRQVGTARAPGQPGRCEGGRRGATRARRRRRRASPPGHRHVQHRRRRPGGGGGPSRVDPGERGRVPGSPRSAGGAPARDGPGARPGLGDRLSGLPRHRDAGRPHPRLPRGARAGAVRAVPAPRPGGPRGGRARGPADPGGAEHPHGGTRAGRERARFPPLGLPARGDPPDAVHLGRLAPWLRAAADDRVPARLRPRPGDHPGPPARDRRRRGRRGPWRRRRQRQPHRGHPDATAAGDPRPPHQRHDAGGRPRRLRDGRRWAAGGPVGRRDPGRLQRPPRVGRRWSRPSAGSWAST